MPGEKVLIKLKESFERLTKAEKKVARYVLDHPNEVASCSIKELAIRCEVSDATILRLCKAVGYKSYRAFIVDIASDLASDSSSEFRYTDITPGDSVERIIQNVAYTNQKSISDTLGVIDLPAVEEAVSLLHTCQKIYFFGMGASNMVCMDAEQKFSRINRSCSMHIDTHGQFVDAIRTTANDVAVIISYSGMTPEVIKIAKLVRETGAKLIAITKYGKSDLSALADVCLWCSSPETILRSGAMGSRIAMLTVIDILFSGVASMEYGKVEPYLIKTELVINENRKK